MPAAGAIPMCGLPYHARRRLHRSARPQGFSGRGLQQVEDPRKVQGAGAPRGVRSCLRTLTDAVYLEAREPGVARRDRPAVDAPRHRRGVLASRPRVQTASTPCRRPAGARPTSSASCARASSCTPRQAGDPATLLGEGTAGPSDNGRRVGVRSEPCRRTLVEQLRTHSLEASASTGIRRRPRRRRAGALLRETQKPTWRTSARLHPHRRRLPPGRSDDDEEPEWWSRVRDPAVSLLDELDRTITPMGGPPRGPGCSRRCSPSTHSRSPRRGRRARLPFDRARQAARHVQDCPRRRAPGRARRDGPPGARPGLATPVAHGDSARAGPARRAAGAAGRSLVAELDDLTDIRAALDEALVEEPPALARDGGAIRDGVDPALDDLRGISRSGKQRNRRDGSGERALTASLAQDPLQPRVRLLHRDLESHLRVCRPTTTQQTIAGGERFIHARAQGLREKVLGADEKILERELALFEAVRAQVVRGGRASRTPPGRCRARRAERARRRRLGANYTKR